MRDLATLNGIIEMSSEEYHSLPGLSNSGMKDLAVSPYRYWHLHINPEREPETETPAMRLGTALHAAVLEGDEAFMRRYACALDPTDWPVCLDTLADLREWITSKGHKPAGTVKDPMIQQALSIMEYLPPEERVPILKEEERRFFAANAGKIILKPAEWRQVSGMSRAILGEPVIQKILSRGKPEQSLFAKDPETGVLLKCRYDWLDPDVSFDLKSFSQKNGKSIDDSVADALFYEGYIRQAYFYSYMRELVMGGQAPAFVFGFCESDPPHETRIKALRPTTGGQANMYWTQARGEVKKYVRQYAEYSARFGNRPWRDQQAVDTLIDEDIRQLAWS